MGQQASGPKSPVVDPGRLGDEECANAVSVFMEYADEGRLTAAGFIQAMDLDESVGASLFCIASRGASELGAQEFVNFAGETTRGSNSARLTHYLCACAGVSSLVDPSTGEPRYVEAARVRVVFELAWDKLLSKHRATASGFDDDSDIISGSTRGKAWSSFDAEPFASSLLKAAENESRSEIEATKHGGSSCTALQGTSVDLSFVARWINRHMPDLPDAWTGYARSRLFNDYKAIFPAPVCLDASEVLTKAHRDAMFCALAMAAAESRGHWTRIYGSGVDGLSFYRLCHQILGWKGPTVLLVKANSGDVFGAYLDTPWKEWHTFYGGSGCFVFALKPTLEICRPRRGPGANRHFMYLNTKGRHKCVCLGSSGDPDSARLRIPEQLGDATVNIRRACLTYEAADLAPSSLSGEVDIDAIEVWGVGDQAAIAEAGKARDESRQTRADHIRKAGTVDRRQFGTSFDREHIFGKTFAGCAQDAEYRRAVREEDTDGA